MTAATKPLSGKRMAPYWRAAQGRCLQGLREQRRMTQLELATAAGFPSKHLISQIENGRGNPPPERWMALADALEMSHLAFAKLMMRTANPWAYAMIWGADESLAVELKLAEAAEDDRRDHEAAEAQGHSAA